MDNKEEKFAENVKRLSEFLRQVVEHYVNEPSVEPVGWIFKSLSVLGSTQKLAAEMLGKLDSGIGSQHEYRLNDADLKLRLVIENDGLVYGHMTCEYEINRYFRNALEYLLRVCNIESEDAFSVNRV